MKSAASEKRRGKKKQDKQRNERPAERQRRAEIRPSGPRSFLGPDEAPEHVFRTLSIVKARINFERHASCIGSEAQRQAEGETRAGEARGFSRPLLSFALGIVALEKREETSASMPFPSDPRTLARSRVFF